MVCIAHLADVIITHSGGVELWNTLGNFRSLQSLARLNPDGFEPGHAGESRAKNLALADGSWREQNCE